MLDSLFRPVLENDLRKEIGRFQCALLVSSCSLIRKVSVTQPPAPSENIASIETRINDSLQSDLTQALGHLYFFDVRFRIGRVTLPVNVQKAVDEVQAQYAAVNTARAELEQARFTARRNRLLGKTYNKSPGLAAIEALKAVPQGSTVILSTGGKTPPILAGAGGGAGSPGATGSTGSANGEGSAKAGDSDDADGG
jgi:regulator of protease activity HflC (stomatin/prohibitin superfamily)